MADITITGRLGGDADMKYTQSGKAVANFSVADDLRKKNDATGEWETVVTTWWRVALWGRDAENLADHLKKGARVIVVGTAHQREYEHNGEKRTSLDVNARSVAVVPRADQPARSSSGSFDADPWSTSEAPF